MRRAIALAVTAILILAGCAGKDATKETASSEAPTASTPTPTPAAASTPGKPATLTREQAAQRYLAIVKPSNAVLDEPKCKQIGDFYSDGGSWPPADQPSWDERPHKVMAECYKRLLPIYEKELKEFQTTAWPADAAADMADLISLAQAHLHCVKQIARAASGDAMSKAIECFAPDDGSADRVRARFGLPIRSTS